MHVKQASKHSMDANSDKAEEKAIRKLSFFPELYPGPFSMQVPSFHHFFSANVCSIQVNLSPESCFQDHFLTAAAFHCNLMGGKRSRKKVDSFQLSTLEISAMAMCILKYNAN